MFKSAGNFKGTVREVRIAKPKFSKNPNAFDVCLHLEGPDGQNDWWRGEVSPDYGKGTVSHLTQAQITLQNLQKVGFVGELHDLYKAKDQLTGKEIEFSVEASTKTKQDGTPYYNIKYVGGSDFAPEQVDDFAARMTAMGFAPNQAGQQQTAAPQTTQQAAAPQTATGGDADVDPWG